LPPAQALPSFLTLLCPRRRAQSTACPWLPCRLYSKPVWPVESRDRRTGGREGRGGVFLSLPHSPVVPSSGRSSVLTTTT